jgi:hypothetical protein
MYLRVASIAAVLLGGSVMSAEAHDPTLGGCRVFVQRSPGHIRVYRADCGRAIQLPRRYAISPAQNFDGWRLDTSRGGIRQYRTPCGGDTFYDGSSCVLWPAAVRNGNGTK